MKWQTITIEVDERTVDELTPLFEESNCLLKAAGYEPWTFEHWYRMMLVMGSTPHIRGNAELLIKQTRNHLERGEKDDSDRC